MNKTTAIWAPAWYELDQSLAVGATSVFAMVKSSSSMRFATGLDAAKDNELRQVEAKILSIYNEQLGKIIRIDTEGLCYKFFVGADTFFQIEAEENPGRIENNAMLGSYLTDTNFLVEIELSPMKR
ncbi:hypothetical protein [Hymenobacter cellulosilyticus]|uniref:Uncharacterized protein n=1 Tax=Hymenobacter cellulosilyticus TaxID=2932248 RepID=A0A8T9QF22_9BACT|nr:hypothetical protein [Hymenobacter cellulosilyticus]UOQ74169.1 hypothetical protein MUN79_09930 [Hymenobacter cellulosilyticus]